MKITKDRWLNIFKYSCLIGYILLSITLIVESCINGTNSAEQSNQVGNTLADVFNDLSGDQAKRINPTSTTISNKIEEAFIGETYKVKTKILPEDCTYNSITYTSSNNDIASISNEGLITFNNEGNVTISINNKEFPTLTDSMNIEVKKVIANSISSEITNATYSNEKEVYILEESKNYSILTTFSPENTTEKTLSYQAISEDGTNYISIDEDGVIHADKHSFNKITTITIQHGNLYSPSLNVIVKKTEIIDAISFNIDDEINIYVNQSKTIKPIFNPTNTTYQDIKLEADSSYLSISNNTIKGLKEGSLDLIVTSKYYSLTKKVKINILPQPLLESFDELSINSNITINSKVKINFSNVIPNYADTSIIKLTSTNENVGLIENGYFVAKALGQTEIIAVFNNQEIDRKTIIVSEKKDNVESFSLNIKKSSFEINSEYLLSNIINVSSWLPNEPNSKDLNFSLEDSSFGTINNQVFTPTKVGITNLLITHISSGITNIVPININYPFKILNDNENEITSISLDYGDTFTFSILTFNDSNNSQTYSFKLPSFISINKINANQYEISSSNKGEGVIEINPIINEIEQKGKSISFEVKETTISSKGYYLSYVPMTRKMIDVRLAIKDTMAIAERSCAYVRPVAINQDYKRVELDKIYSSNIEYSIGDESIATINPEGNIARVQPVGLGETTLTIIDRISYNSAPEEEKKLYKIEIKILIVNQVTLLTNNHYSLKGNSVVENGNGYYEIINGNSATLTVNFDWSKTTYSNVIYSSSNEDVAKIDNDGIITPLKEGKTIIKFTCYDGITPTYLSYAKVEEEIHLTVKKQELITDLNSFLIKVRKGIGHFGAFLVLGIFSSFTYLLFFEQKKWKWSIPLNLSQGIFLAGITEIIQLFVPGRGGLLSDVLIDSIGFIISSFIITAIMIIYYFYKKSKEEDI